MAIPCKIVIEGVPYKPRKPYTFACLPRIGETISLEWDEGRYPSFTVFRIIHVPDDVQELPAFTVLYVRKDA